MAKASKNANGNANQSAKTAKIMSNAGRQNGKAWKVRACGTRHAPGNSCGKAACAPVVTKEPVLG